MFKSVSRCFTMFLECFMMFYEWLTMYHNVLQVFRDVLLCFTMFSESRNYRHRRISHRSPQGRFEKSTHISMISNCNTSAELYKLRNHWKLRADIAGNSARSLTSPSRHLRIERRYCHIKWPPCDRQRRCPKRRHLQYRRIKWRVFECFMMFHNVLRVFHNVLQVVHDVLRCIKMFYMCFMMFYYV